MNDNEWYKYNVTLFALVSRMHARRINNQKQFDAIVERLLDYSIENVTVGDISDFIRKKLKLDKKTKLSDNDIIEFIMNEENREILVEFGQIRNPIDTRRNDALQKEKDYNAWNQML